MPGERPGSNTRFEDQSIGFQRFSAGAAAALALDPAQGDALLILAEAALRRGDAAEAMARWRDYQQRGGTRAVHGRVGTALLALAAGTVVTKGEGGQAEGIYVWLRHAPQDTGLADWVYAKYQHLATLPDLALGARVAVGQVLGRSGKTGTVGGHYGPSGYPHLHLTMLRSAAGEYRVEGTRVSAPGGYLFDPVAVYHEAQASGAARPSRGDTAVAIPYVTTDGQASPAGTRVVWPVACRPR